MSPNKKEQSDAQVLSLVKSLGELDVNISSDAIHEPIEHSEERVFKLRFTRKQFEDFRDACNMIRKIGNDKDLAKIVSQRLEITEKNLQTKVINPVCASPLKLIKSKPKNKQSDDNKEKKITFFTKSVPTNNKIKMLHEKASNLKKLNLRYNPDEETCLTDVRTMLTQYINLSNLKTDVGMYMDDFLAELLDMSEFPLLKQDDETNQVYIAKEDRKTIIAMARKIME